MQNNVVADQFNRTKLTGCALEKIEHDLAKNKFQNCEQGSGGDHTA